MMWSLIVRMSYSSIQVGWNFSIKNKFKILKRDFIRCGIWEVFADLDVKIYVISDKIKILDLKQRVIRIIIYYGNICYE